MLQSFHHPWRRMQYTIEKPHCRYYLYIEFDILMSHPVFGFSSFLESGFPLSLDFAVSSVVEDELPLSLESFLGSVESPLVCAMCSGFSVSLCHIDFRNPSFV
jgi:hypothetical protein